MNRDVRGARSSLSPRTDKLAFGHPSSRVALPLLAALVAMSLGPALSGCGAEGPAAKPAESGKAAVPSETKTAENKAPAASAAKAEPPATGQWGNLRGRFVYEGKPPKPTKIVPDKDVEVCSKHPLFVESLLVADDGGIANVLVFVRTEKINVHPDYEKSAKEPVIMNNHNCRFEPHLALLRTGQPLLVKNSDPVGHNTKVSFFKNASFNDLIPSGSQIEKTFSAAERSPAPVACNIHPWMSGHLLVRGNPYMAATAKDGTFTIENLPTGEYEFEFWQEKAKRLGGIELGSQGKTNKRGRAKLAIAPGDNDLGDIQLAKSLFEK